MEVSYRRAELGDLQRLADIYNHAVHNTAATFDTEEKPPEHFQTWVPGDSMHRMLVAVVEGVVVAYAGVYPFSPRKAYAELAVIMVYVHPDWHRQQIGTRLMQQVHADVDFLHGFHTVISIMNKENIHTHKLFQKVGYVYRGELIDVGLKFGKRHSTVIYQRNVQQHRPELEEDGS